MPAERKADQVVGDASNRGPVPDEVRDIYRRVAETEQPLFPQSPDELAREISQEAVRTRTGADEGHSTRYDHGYADGLDSAAGRVRTLGMTLEQKQIRRTGNAAGKLREKIEAERELLTTNPQPETGCARLILEAHNAAINEICDRLLQSGVADEIANLAAENECRRLTDQVKDLIKPGAQDVHKNHYDMGIQAAADTIEGKLRP